MADAGYNQASQGTWVEGDTILYRGVAAILCKNATVQVVLEGAQEPTSVSLGRGGVALLVRGQVFQRDEIQALSWGAVARELAELEGLPEIRRLSLRSRSLRAPLTARRSKGSWSKQHGAAWLGRSVGRFHLEDKKIKNKYAYPEDLLVAEAAAREMNLEWKHHVMDLTEDGLRVVLSGLGSEEAFAGYQRHARACVAGDEATSRDRTLGLAQMWHRDLQRDFILASLAGVEIRYPFLDADLLDVALHLPAAEILANDAAKRREQVAGAGNPFHQADFVMSVPGASHSPVALLLTSGYHSIQVYCLLTSWRCEISCVVGSVNDGGRAAAFARSVQLPLLDMKVSMSKHGYDMESLTDALKAAKEHYGIEGAACGHVCDLDLWGGVAAACDLVGLRAYAPEWGACSEVQSSMRRLVHDGTVLQLTKFPDPAFLGCTVATPGEADEVLSTLRSICGPHATDDTDGGYVDCEFVSNRFLPCGVREIKGLSISDKVRSREASAHEGTSENGSPAIPGEY
ncbi:putative asparagine synthetase [glutamine-hydrolyzing] 1 [Symbiodinium microadriaticum]|uniref:Putative asparagine synthetase [glutamine-hydrolyzing] 1 n=1 Tax=Symbiodinium microadriaticum TaxID=2951 RepID=A0A1Q9EUU6_SYMMI|nr:putative asparagine synthetase [glutamine-hydrolyzing] 1 [Symbiodinium microadriaticum]